LTQNFCEIHQPWPAPERPTKPSLTRTTDESWQRRLELAHQRIKGLTEENKQLRTQLALAHGQRRPERIGLGKDTVPKADALTSADECISNPSERMIERWVSCSRSGTTGSPSSRPFAG
jgi:hypothetical protein